MSDLLTPQKNLTVSIDNPADEGLIVKIGKALSIPERIQILRSILTSSKNLSTLSEELNLPTTSVARHLEVLEEAGLIYFSYQPSKKGHAKFCSQAIASVSVSLDLVAQQEEELAEYVVEMPLGLFSHCHVKAPCGMTGKDVEMIGFDNPNVFFSPARYNAECIWFNSGFISYNFPTDFSRNRQFSEITFTFEICSETVYYNNAWPSDITICINNKEILTFTSPGDFGGRRGKYTPNYWPITSTQFGLLKKVTVNSRGAFIDNIFVSDKIKFEDLRIFDGSAIKLDIGVKEDAVHKGGLNLFGKNFGDYPQSIIMSLK